MTPTELATHAIMPVYAFILFMLCRRQVAPARLLPALLALLAANFVMVRALVFATPLLPKVFDTTAIALDGTLGFQPAAATAWLFDACPPLMYVCGLVYIWLPATLAWSLGLEMRSGQRQGIGFLPTFLCAGVLGYALYYLMPVVGPSAFMGPDFANLLLLPGPVAAHADYSMMPRNGVPSMHTAWAVLAFLATRGQTLPFRSVSFLFLICTILATLGLGMHYLIDLVVALPFVLLVRGVFAVQAAWTWERLVAVSAGAACLAGWCGVIRGGVPRWFMPVAPVAMLLTVGLSVWLEMRLAEAERGRGWYRAGRLRLLEAEG